MEMTKMKEARKRMDRKKSGPDPLLDLAGWVSVIFGVILVLLGLWTQFHGEGGPLTASYRDDTVYVEAMYGKEARIPKEAELRARLITPEEDPEMYSQNMTSAMAVMGRDGEAVPTNAIYNVGFYVGDQEVEPEAPVNVTLQVLKDGFAVGEPVRVVHLAEDDAEVLADTSVDDAGFISFTTDGFSSFAFVSRSGRNEDNQEEPGIALTSLNDGDMTGLLSDVSIENQKGETVTDGKLFVGEKYTIHLKFTEGGLDGDQFEWNDAGQMTYQIPKNFSVMPRTDVPLRVTIDGVEVEIGNFSVDENGLLTVQLTEEGKQKLTGSNDIGLSFDMDATAQKTEGGGDEDVHFGDIGEDFHFVVTDQPQITVEKLSKYYDNSKLLEYTVHTTVDHGPVKDLVVSDTLTPPQTPGITLEMINTGEGADAKPDIKVTVMRDGKTIELTEVDYELVPVEPSPANPYAPQTFKVVLKEESAYNPLQTGDELFVNYQYNVEFDASAANQFYANIVNDATVTGSFPLQNPGPDGENEIPVEQTRHSEAEVWWADNGNGVVYKTQHYNEATGRIHYTLYALAKAGEYTPFYIQDHATMEYDSNTWTIQNGFDEAYCKDLTVYAQDIENWDDLVDKDGHLKPEAVTGDRKRLTGYENPAYMTAPGYSADSMDNYVSVKWEKGDGITILFGIDKEYKQYKEGHWNYKKDRLITVEYDLDVSNGLTLCDGTGKTITLSKDDALLTGITNIVTLRYGPFYPTFSTFFSNGEKLNKYGRLDKVNNTIDYTVSLNLKDTTVWEYMRGLLDGSIQNAMFVDDYDDGWEYVDGTLKATLYDGYGGSAEYSYNYSVVDGSGGKVAKDEPDGFSPGKIEAYLNKFYMQADWGIGVLGYAFASPMSNLDRIEFTYTLKASDKWIQEHANGTVATDTDILNSAVIKDDTMTHWSAGAKVLYFPNRLSKTAQQDGTSNLITFTLDINSVGANLDKDKDYLIVIDDSTGIQIKPDSIKVTDKDGTPLTGIGDTTIDATLAPDQWGLLPTEDEHQYKLKVPDGKALRITYDALITEMGESVTVSNKASIGGVARSDSNYEGALKVDDIHGSGEGSTHQLTIEKVDSKNNSKKLPEAEFELYIVKPESGTSSEEQYNEKITIGETTYDCRFAQKLTTGSDGSVPVDSQYLEPGRYYILKETKAPEGYKELEGPVLFYFGLKKDGIDPTVAIAPPDGMLTVGDPPIEYNLPETGGPGTLFYMVTGLMLVLGSGILLTFKKRLRQAR